MNMNVVIRADASLDIGTGHVMRCLTLADALRERGASCKFICREHPGNLLELIRQHGHQAHALPIESTVSDESLTEYSAWLGADWMADAQQAIAGIGSAPVDWLIVDHYALDARWESRVRSVCRRLMVIDDLADRPHDCDLLLDQNLRDPVHYVNLVPKACDLLLGPKYALLRPQFATARLSQRKRHGQVSRLLVFFGGVDANGETLKALTAVRMLGRENIGVDVVIGENNPHQSAIALACNEMSSVRLYRQVKDMATRMATADLFIGSGGTSSWERCCLGLPSIVMTTASNQVEHAQALDSLGGQIFIGESKSISADMLKQVIAVMIGEENYLRKMENVGLKLVDGCGVKRVVHHLQA